jgi:hypothetical protein
MTLEEKYAKAMELLDRMVATEVPVPDHKWCVEYWELTGDHMILTDEGWESGDVKQSYLDEWAKNPEWSDPILDEVNAPVPC